MKIIAFAGPARAGKSACADIVTEIYSKAEPTEKNPFVYLVERESFAQPMRDAWQRLASYLTWKLGKLVNRDTEPALYRSTMQRWGESRRSRDPDHWVKRMRDKLMNHKATEIIRYMLNDDVKRWRETLVVIEDLRYPNELQLVRQFDGLCIFVDPRGRIPLDEPFRQHESEELANGYMRGDYPDETFDSVVTNGGSVPRLVNKLKTIVGPWLREVMQT